MAPQSIKVNSIWILTPVFGALLFVVLYIIAADSYPGGSQADKNSVGFSWINNYWCNLLNDNAVNGQHNPAKPVAMAGMLVLCVTLSFFWYIFPQYIRLRSMLARTTQICGILAMATAFLLYTHFNHDFIINLASIFGLVATVGIFVGLHKVRWYWLFAFGWLNIFLVGLNNYLYNTNGMIVYLPLVQKISFASFLLWFCCIDINLYRKSFVQTARV